MVIMFYVLAGIIALVHIVFFFILDLYPKRPILLYNDENFVFKDALEWIGQSALLSLGWLIALSMFHLTISLRLIFKLTTPEQARVHKKMASISATIIVVIELIYSAMVPVFISNKVGD